MYLHLKLTITCGYIILQFWPFTNVSLQLRIQFSEQDVYDLWHEVRPVRVGGGGHGEDTALYQFRGQVLVTSGREIEPGESRITTYTCKTYMYI